MQQRARSLAISLSQSPNHGDDIPQDSQDDPLLLEARHLPVLHLLPDPVAHGNLNDAIQCR